MMGLMGGGEGVAPELGANAGAAVDAEAAVDSGAADALIPGVGVAGVTADSGAVSDAAIEDSPAIEALQK
jgi:hypothetical protein